MTKVAAGLAGMVFSVCLAACGGQSTSAQLVGTWTFTSSQNGGTGTETLDLNSNGTASSEISISGSEGGDSCSGSLTFSGFTWTSTGTTITLSGSDPTCSGTISCGGVPLLDCSSGAGTTSVQSNGTCDYTLSNDSDTLTLTCNADGGTTSTVFTRQG